VYGISNETQVCSRASHAATRLASPSQPVARDAMDGVKLSLSVPLRSQVSCITSVPRSFQGVRAIPFRGLI
jgi:hypothetical protein